MSLTRGIGVIYKKIITSKPNITTQLMEENFGEADSEGNLPLQSSSNFSLLFLAQRNPTFEVCQVDRQVVSVHRNAVSPIFITLRCYFQKTTDSRVAVAQ